jgi:hypothetical protein
MAFYSSSRGHDSSAEHRGSEFNVITDLVLCKRVSAADGRDNLGQSMETESGIGDPQQQPQLLLLLILSHPSSEESWTVFSPQTAPPQRMTFFESLDTIMSHLNAFSPSEKR